MPLYEYQCDACGHRFEVIQKFSDAPIGVCPKCGSAVHKLFSSPAIQFKGSGWYITDYAKKDGPSAVKTDASESGSKSEGAKTDGTKSEGTKGDGAKSEGSKSESSKSESSSASSSTDSSSSSAAKAPAKE